jgi:hypothetical protein
VKKFILTVIICLFLLPYVSFAESGFKINSATLTPGYDIGLSLKNAKKLGIDTINLSVKIDIDSIKSSKAKISSEEKENLKNSLRRISNKRYRIFIELFPWINDGENVETEYNPSNKRVFFRTWAKCIYEVLEICKDYEIEGLLIENNFISLYQYERNWTKIINNVREKTNAKIGFKINWWYNADWDPESYEYYRSLFNLSYLRKVDFISIPAYFELADQPTDNVDQLVEAWKSSKRYDRKQPIYEQIKRLSEHYDKKIFFGEVGYTKYRGTTVEPWNYSLNSKIDRKEQAAAFEAFFQTFKDSEFVLGYSLFQIGVYDSRYYFMDSGDVKNTIKYYIKQ